MVWDDALAVGGLDCFGAEGWNSEDARGVVGCKIRGVLICSDPPWTLDALGSRPFDVSLSEGRIRGVAISPSEGCCSASAGLVI